MTNTTDSIQPSEMKEIIHPGRMERVMSLALLEILGPVETSKLLDLADLLDINAREDISAGVEFKFRLKYLNKLQVGLDQAYGTRAGRGLAMRIGRSCFKYSLTEFAPELCLSDLSFKLLPLQLKVRTSNEAFVALFNGFAGWQILLHTDERNITWQIQTCPLCLHRQAVTPCCDLLVGWLQEAMYWVSGGKYFDVREEEWFAGGYESCAIRINCVPIM